MMKVFSKCSVVLFTLMLFFGNSNSCYGMKGKNVEEEVEKLIKNEKKKNLMKRYSKFFLSLKVFL